MLFKIFEKLEKPEKISESSWDFIGYIIKGLENIKKEIEEIQKNAQIVLEGLKYNNQSNISGLIKNKSISISILQVEIITI